MARHMSSFPTCSREFCSRCSATESGCHLEPKSGPRAKVQDAHGGWLAAEVNDESLYFVSVRASNVQSSYACNMCRVSQCGIAIYVLKERLGGYSDLVDESA